MFLYDITTIYHHQRDAQNALGHPIAAAAALAYATPMQWVFLILALWAALVELHTGTFYLAAVAAVAFVTFALGFVLPEEILLVTFLGGLLAALVLIWITRRHAARRTGLRDFDLDQEVRVESLVAGTDRLIVTYRGTRWEAEMATGPALSPGATARIVGRRDHLLRVSPLPPVAQEPS